MHAVPIAAGFLEPSDMPGRVVFVSLAYSASVIIPLMFFVRFRRAKSAMVRAILLGIAVALLGPLAIRQIAIIVQGPSWADWHFIWLYLLASSAATFVYFTAVLIWRLIRYAHPPTQSLEPTAGRRDDRI